jgi:hypothetical protein
MSKVKARAAALVVVAGLSPTTVNAVEQSKLTLACEGTTTETTMPDAKPEPISMGIIVGHTARTVQGFGYPGYFPVNITGMNEVTVSFSGSSKGGAWTINGSIDRVTGDVTASSTVASPKTAILTSFASSKRLCTTRQLENTAQYPLQASRCAPSSAPRRQ